MKSMMEQSLEVIRILTLSSALIIMMNLFLYVVASILQESMKELWKRHGGLVMSALSRKSVKHT